ncbi:MAG: hypothetical protein LCH96_05355 [Actinobacteria bacterium]|nr:hypothetical protein [Actinomycetota bacterium]
MAENDDELPFPAPWLTPEVQAWLEADAKERAEAEHRRKHPDFATRRQRDLAAARAARREALERGEMVLGPPRPGDRPEVVAEIETRVEGMPDAPRWARDARAEAVRILVDGALAMSGSGLRLEGEPAGALQQSETVAADPEPARPKPRVTKARRRPQKAVQRRKKPKVRPAPKTRQERPAPPDEVRCTATNSHGSRCRFEAVADARCLLHGSAVDTGSPGGGA